jgi:hypothetical protein
VRRVGKDIPGGKRLMDPGAIVIGKRIPVGAAVGGLVTFSVHMWNLTHPDVQISVAAAGGLSMALVALVQVIVVNVWGITSAESKE